MKNVNTFKSFFFALILIFFVNFNAYGYDFLGNDIGYLDAQNPDQCANACNNNSQCQAWTFVTLWGRCFLKNPVPAPSEQGVCAGGNCLSGLKRSDNWCGETSSRTVGGSNVLGQEQVLSCPSGQSCGPKRSTSCSGWWIFRSCTTLVSTDYFCL
jgi:hypothetical protein